MSPSKSAKDEDVDMSFFDELRNKLPPSAIKVQCVDEHGKCKVVFSDTFDDKQVLINLDLVDFPPNRRHCDFIFWGECSTCRKRWLVAVEFKAGALNAADADQQLDGGVQFAQSQMSASDGFTLHPVIVFGRECPRIQLKRLSRCRINFFGKKYAIQAKRTPMYFPEDV